jgi:hypothetical protein
MLKNFKNSTANELAEKDQLISAGVKEVREINDQLRKMSETTMKHGGSQVQVLLDRRKIDNERKENEKKLQKIQEEIKTVNLEHENRYKELELLFCNALTENQELKDKLKAKDELINTSKDAVRT